VAAAKAILDIGYGKSPEALAASRTSLEVSLARLVMARYRRTEGAREPALRFRVAMSLTKRCADFVSGAMWIGLAAPAEAATVVVPASVTFTATGTVNTGVDASDLFGGGDLIGLAFVATYVFQASPSTLAPYYCCAGSSTGPGGTLSFLNPRTASTIRGCQRVWQRRDSAFVECLFDLKF